jgi:glycolate oxidase iron-sulfur subunit
MATELEPKTATHAHDESTLSVEDGIARCVHCGFCLQACPTYLELGMETDSPRGRIALIGALREGRAGATPSLLSHLDLCLQCRACETACPSGVPYGRIMEDARAMVIASGNSPFWWRLRAVALRQVLQHPGRIRALVGALRLYQRTSLRQLVRSSRILRHLPGNLAAAEASLPEAPARPFDPPPQPAGLTKSVALLTGCVMPHLYPQTHAATVRVLNRLGFRVVFPSGQTCCGALSLHGGDRVFARGLARRNIDAFLAADVEAVIVNAAGCGSTMKEYGELLVDDPRYRDRAASLAARTRDVLEFVAERDLGALGRVPASVTYQDSCHLVHAQRVRTAPREILSAIPGLDLREMTAPDRCCGSAGIYSFVQREMSARLLAHKMDDISETGARVIATANPGCVLQLEAGVRQRGLDARVVHVIELLDAAMEAAGR